MGRMKVYGASWTIPGVPNVPHPFAGYIVVVPVENIDFQSSSLPVEWPVTVPEEPVISSMAAQPVTTPTTPKTSNKNDFESPA